jgi:hypothetical protein
VPEVRCVLESRDIAIQFLPCPPPGGKGWILVADDEQVITGPPQLRELT